MNRSLVGLAEALPTFFVAAGFTVYRILSDRTIRSLADAIGNAGIVWSWLLIVMAVVCGIAALLQHRVLALKLELPARIVLGALMLGYSVALLLSDRSIAWITFGFASGFVFEQARRCLAILSLIRQAELQARLLIKDRP